MGGSPTPNDGFTQSAALCDHQFIAIEFKIVDAVKEKLEITQLTRVTKILCPKCSETQDVNWSN